MAQRRDAARNHWIWGGHRGKPFQKLHSYRVLVDPCQKAKCAEHTRVPQGFITKPNALGFPGISSVLLQACCKELMPLRGREVAGDTFTLLWQWAEPCELLLGVSEFLTAGLSFSVRCFPTTELAIKICALLFHCVHKQQKQEDCFGNDEQCV